jgi:eukaryotic-like serine/threonine-protein kinase
VRSELTKKTVRFGAFALDLDTGELRRHGIRVRLQDKSFQIVQALLEQSGQVVTRDDLRKRLWPDDTFVDFESGLNTAVNRLRLALGDSAENPTYIETVARKGYRFIGVVAEALEHVEPVRVETAVTPIQFSPPARPWTLVAIIAAAVLIALALWITRRAPAQASFHQITFRQGIVGSARFAPDGQTILYTANWEGKGSQLYLANTVSPESREVGYRSVLLAGVSTTTELALLFLDPTSGHRGGNLSRVPLNGGAPLTIATKVFGAEWTTDGKGLAIYRKEPRESVIEYPIGKVLYRTAGDITHLRISPRGDGFAFLEHPVRGDDGGMVRWVDLHGVTRDLTGWWASAVGLAWSPSGREVWFTASQSGVRRALYAVTVSGALRQIAVMPGALMLFDISRSGRVLLSLDRERMMIQASLNGQPKESDATWFDWSHAQDISPDGKWMLFDETGEGGGPNHGVFLRNAVNNSVVRLGDGKALALSPDQKWAVALNTSKPTSLSFLTDAPEMPRSISGNGLTYRRVRFFPDGRHLLVSGNLPGKPLRLFVQPVNGGAPAPLNPDVYLDFAVISPDGKQIAGLDENQKAAVVPASGGLPQELAIPFPAMPLEWSADGKALFIKEIGCCPPVKISRFDFATSQVRPWKQMAPADSVGVSYMMDVIVARDEHSYAYSYPRTLSELFVVDGWH